MKKHAIKNNKSKDNFYKTRFQVEHAMNIDAVGRLITKFLFQHQEIRIAYLYGSFIRGMQFEDIDVGIVLDSDFTPDHLYQEGIALELEENLRNTCNIKKPVDVRILNSVKNVRFLNSIMKNAKLLFSKNILEKARFESKILLDYFDMKPFYELYDKSRMLRYESR